MHILDRITRIKGGETNFSKTKRPPSKNHPNKIVNDKNQKDEPKNINSPLQFKGDQEQTSMPVVICVLKLRKWYQKDFWIYIFMT